MKYNEIKVAFDCSGTLLDNKKSQYLFDWFNKKGCQMIIWSSFTPYCYEAKKLLEDKGIDTKNVIITEKVIKDFLSEDDKNYVNICVDDDIRQTYLSSDNFILVNNIDENFDNKYNELLDNIMNLHQ